MSLKLITFLIVIFYLKHVISQYSADPIDWKNYLDYCEFKTISNEFTKNILSRDVFIEKHEDLYLGPFFCITINNENNNYRELTIKFNGTALYRKVESNVCRKYPDNNDYKEHFTTLNERSIRIAIYSPWSPSHKTEVVRIQDVSSIKLNGDEVIRGVGQTVPSPSVPNLSSIPIQYPNSNQNINSNRETDITPGPPRQPINPPRQPSRPPQQSISPNRQPSGNAALREQVLKSCRDVYDSSPVMDCEVEDKFFIKRLEGNNKTLWCIYQSGDTIGQFDFTLSNSNYDLYQTSNEILGKANDNKYKLNEHGEGGHRYPTIVGALQSDVQFEAPSIDEVRFRYLKICATPLLGRPYTCGQRNTTALYFDENVQRGDYPWQVNIYELGNQAQWNYKCGGTIINPSTILTAAQCVHDGSILKSPHIFRVHFNEVSQAKTVGTSYKEEREVFQIIPHENYMVQYHEYDLALLKLSSPIDSLYYNPTCLTNNHLFLDNRNCVISGYGVDLYDQKFDTLKQAEIIKLKNDRCRNRNNFFRIYLTETKFCGEYKPGTYICPENPGSALYCQVDNKWYLNSIITREVGRTSGRCSASEFMLFTDATETYKWIVEHSK